MSKTTILTVFLLSLSILTITPCMAQQENDQQKKINTELEEQYVPPKVQQKQVHIDDPLQPVNRVVFVFNDKLYFWVLKPAAQGYKVALPRPARKSIGNFFKNVTTPIRFTNSLLQGEFNEAGTVLKRFAINTTWGVAGLSDPAKTELNIKPQKADFGQTLGKYHMPHLIYINWPVLGPSSVRNTFGKVGDYFLDPTSYLKREAGIAATATDKINTLSFQLGRYKEIKQAALDPYIAIRDGFLQRRKALVEDKDERNTK